MIDLSNRKLLDDGTVLCGESVIMELLYQGKTLDGVTAEPCESVELHNAADRMLDTALGAIETSDGEVYGRLEWAEHWLTPEPYASMDIVELCVSKCKNQAELERTAMELDLFDQRGMMPILRHLVYLMDDWRSRNIVWGVGRGSSVSSFVLYLIGINRINPMEWGLGIEEFLK